MIFDIYSIYCLREIYSIYCLRENRKMHRQQTLWLLFDIALQVLNVLLSSVQTLCVSSSLSESRVKTRKYLVGQDIIQQNIFGWHFNWFNCLVLPHSSVIIPVWVTSHCTVWSVMCVLGTKYRDTSITIFGFCWPTICSGVSSHWGHSLFPIHWNIESYNQQLNPLFKKLPVNWATRTSKDINIDCCIKLFYDSIV